MVGGARVTCQPLVLNNGQVQATTLLLYVAVYDVVTKALVTTRTNIYTDSSGVFTFTDPALTVSGIYSFDWETANGERRMPRTVAT